MIFVPWQPMEWMAVYYYVANRTSHTQKGPWQEVSRCHESAGGSASRPAGAMKRLGLIQSRDTQGGKNERCHLAFRDFDPYFSPFVLDLFIVLHIVSACLYETPSSIVVLGCAVGYLFSSQESMQYAALHTWLQHLYNNIFDVIRQLRYFGSKFIPITRTFPFLLAFDRILLSPARFGMFVIFKLVLQFMIFVTCQLLWSIRVILQFMMLVTCQLLWSIRVIQLWFRKVPFTPLFFHSLV
jgi:hypothetical protein